MSRGANENGRRRLPDLGALVAVSLARPLSSIEGTTPARLRGSVTARPTSIHDVGLNAVTRTLAWFLLAIIWLGVGAVAMIIENIAAGPPAQVTPPFVWPPLVAFLITGVFTAVRAGVAWYVTDERWAHAGVVLRWVVTPGNRDLVIAVVLIAFGVLIGNVI